MIILITGASHTGKTLLAQRMLEEYKYPYLSIDHLKMGLIRSGNTALTPEDDDSLTEYLWPIVREIIKTAIENQQNLIIEGCYIPFDWRQDFGKRYLPSIQFICLAMTDKYIDAHFDSIKEHSSDIESRLDDTAYMISNLKTDNQRYIEGHRRSGEQITLIDADYELTINSLLAEKHMGKALSDMTMERPNKINKGEIIVLDRMDQLLIAMMEHEEKDAKRIQHLLKVHKFARLIGRMEGLPADVQEILEAAAVVHDIGIHPAEQKYGSCDGPYQELEGPPLARKLLGRLGWEKAVIERVAWLVGHHHTYTDIQDADHQILVEADFLVNLFENNQSSESQREVYRRIFRTEGGRKLFQTIFIWE